MNRISVLLLIVISTCFCYTANGQNKKYLIGIEGWGSIERGDNVAGIDNTRTSTNEKIYAAKFINPKTAIYAYFDVEYLGFRATGDAYSPVDGNGKYTTREYYVTPQLGFGVRKYFSFTDKNVVGLLADVEAGYGIRVKRFKYKGEFSNTTKEVQATENASLFNTQVITGAYYNLNRNWQFIFKLGGLYYGYLWSKDELQIIGNTFLPSKGRRMGLKFNSESFRLSFVRLI